MKQKSIDIGHGFLLHESGLLIDTRTRRLTDPHGTKASKLFPHLEEQYGHMLRPPLKYHKVFPDCRNNYLDATKWPELANLLVLSDIVICGGCKSYGSTMTASSHFEQHLGTSKKCKRTNKANIKAKGCFYLSQNQWFVFVVVKHYNEEDQDLATTITTEARLKSEVQDLLNLICLDLQGDILPDRDSAAAETLREFTQVRSVYQTTFPYVLLDCIIDALKRENHAMVDTLQFLLRPVGPRLVLFDRDQTFDIHLTLQNDSKYWTVTIEVITPKEGDGYISKFKRTDSMVFKTITFESLCDILVVFRAIMVILLRNVVNQKDTPTGSALVDFIAMCYKQVSAGPEVALAVMKKQLFSHISKIYEYENE